MASVVAIVGKTGAGKSSGLKFLNPDKTMYINADGKDLPFKGWRTMYNGQKKNYLRTSDARTIRKAFQVAIDNPETTAFVIDTMNGIMLDDEMKRAKEKGFDKWQDLASAVYDMIQEANKADRGDFVVFMLFHEESFMDDDGVRTTRILTNGKKLNKIQLETKITTVLWAKVSGEDGKNTHWFETKQNNNTAKSPDGMFDEFKIDNDLEFVRKKVVEYNN
jgi:hypothetical protein